VILLALLVINGLVCWLNTLQHTSLLSPVVHVGNYALLGLWFGAFASVRTGRHLWIAVVVGLTVIVSHAYLFVARPAHFTAGWTFWLTNALELFMLVVLVIQELRADRTASEPRSVPAAPLAQVVPIRATVVSATAGVRRAA
jgi:hypothetical protein